MLIITNSVINRKINTSNVTVTLCPPILLNKFQVFKKMCQIKYTKISVTDVVYRLIHTVSHFWEKYSEFDYYHIWSVWTKTKSAWQLWLWTFNTDSHKTPLSKFLTKNIKCGRNDFCLKWSFVNSVFITRVEILIYCLHGILLYRGAYNAWRMCGCVECPILKLNGNGVHRFC